jgi:threonylcarbamoyladenosine tRNA methylthiotransferase MtaB
LKIQDGCDSRCAYCRVSIARGKSRSLVSTEVLKDLASLENRGFAEAVLTGVNIAQYRDSDYGLPELLDFLLDGTDKIMIRLSSIEPDLFTRLRGAGEFIRILANKRIRPHFHFSVQSGSLKILEKMGRAYSPADIEAAVEKIRSVREDPFLACDIIAGFPGETDKEFAETLELCEKIGFAWIHAFPFSSRPGTAAHDFPERVSEKQIKRRVELLTALGQRGRSEYLSRWIGKEVEAVVEAGPEYEIPSYFVPALSENYLKLLVSCRNKSVPRAGTAIRCRLLPKEVLCDFLALHKYRQFDALAELAQ